MREKGKEVGGGMEGRGYSGARVDFYFDTTLTSYGPTTLSLPGVSAAAPDAAVSPGRLDLGRWHSGFGVLF